VSAPITRDEPVTRAVLPVSEPGCKGVFTIHDPIVEATDPRSPGGDNVVKPLSKPLNTPH
jgi:hypothetical protein